MEPLPERTLALTQVELREHLSNLEGLLHGFGNTVHVTRPIRVHRERAMRIIGLEDDACRT